MNDDTSADGATTSPDSPEPAAVDLDRLLSEEGIPDAEVIDGVTFELEPHHLGLELPDDPAEARSLLLRELAEARQEASEYLDTLQRLAADFENYRRRVERDQAENTQRASQRIVEAMLPTLDAFDAALGYEAQSDGEAKLLDGMRGTHTQLIETLTREGLQAVAADPGTPFDPAVHEAVAGGGGDGEPVVATELRRGYRMRDRLLRPAMVTVENGG